MTIPDFAVSSQEAGFDEFLKVFNEYFKLSCRGEFLFYGASDGQPQRDDIRWTNKFILPHAAIALLTGKQLTEGDLIVKEDMICPITKKHCDDECCTVGSICNVSGNQISDLLPTQESVKERNGDPSMDEMIQLVEQLESDKFHLQQELKEAKELLEKTTSFCEDENMYPSFYKTINQFLTRNQ